MNRQVNPNHCYDTEQGAYELRSAFQVDGTRDSPEWHVMKDGRKHRTFTSLTAAQGWLEHVLEQGGEKTAAQSLAEIRAAHRERISHNGVWHCPTCGSANLVEEALCHDCGERPKAPESDRSRIIVGGNVSPEFKAKLAASLKGGAK